MVKHFTLHVFEYGNYQIKQFSKIGKNRLIHMYKMYYNIYNKFLIEFIYIFN